MIKSFHPQLATLSEAVPTSDEWIHETKWDGYRLIADKKDGVDWNSIKKAAVIVCEEEMIGCILNKTKALVIGTLIYSKLITET